jgi:hypothetical protein
MIKNKIFKRESAERENEPESPAEARIEKFLERLALPKRENLVNGGGFFFRKRREEEVNGGASIVAVLLYATKH